MTKLKLVKTEETAVETTYKAPKAQNNEFKEFGVLRGGFPSESFRYEPEKFEDSVNKKEDSANCDDEEIQAA